MPSAKFPWPRSLRLQLMASYGLALLLTGAALGAAMYALLISSEEAIARKGLALQARWIDDSLQFDAAGRPSLQRGEDHFGWIYDGASNDLKYVLLDGAGRVLLASDPQAQPLAPPGERFDPARPQFRLVADGVPMRVLTLPLQRNGRTYYVQTARSDRFQDLTIRSIAKPVLRTTLYGAVASLLVLAVVVYFTLQRTLRPLRLASQAAAAVAPDNLSERLQTAGLPTELTPLVDAFNQALDRLAHGYRVQQDFLAGAAHELKTPLALIRAQIECDDTRPDRAALLRDIDLMARQVNQLLHLAEASEAQNYVIQPTRVAEVASDVTGFLARLADQRQVLLRVEPGSDAGRLIDADESATFVMLKNLVENAIRHSLPGGTVTVAIGDTGLWVQDSGPGIAEEDLPRLFTRFWRGADRRDDGAGLGLAICQQIARTHGWRLAAHNRAPGARFTVDFAPPAGT